MTETDPLSIAILGIPVQPLTNTETVQAILNLVEEYRKDEHPRYVATLNVDFLTNTHGWSWNQPCSAELLQILRGADLVTLDGMPLVYFGKALGADVPERVTGVDLISKLASEAAISHYPLFLLGGSEKVVQLTAIYLEAENPHLKVVGTKSPQIDFEGSALAAQELQDRILVEEINQHKPSLLLLNLGNPKQEVWFERNREKLKVPVTIGVGGSFDLLTGMIPRAPLWMQTWGLEWLYRLYQEPKRLLKRYALGLVKFPWLALPPLLYSFPNRRNKEDFFLSDPLLFIAAHQTFSLQKLPELIDAQATRELLRRTEDLLAHEKLLLDFSDVRYCSLEGLGWLIQLWQKGKREGKQVLALMVPASIRSLFRLHRMWDIIETDYCKTPKHALEQINFQEQYLGFYDAVEQNPEQMRLTIFGNLDRHADADSYLEKRGTLFQQKRCIVDLRYCTYIDNSGELFLQKMKSYCKEHLSTFEVE